MKWKKYVVHDFTTIFTLTVNQQQLRNTLEWLCKSPKCTTYRVNLLQTSPEYVKNDLLVKLKDKYGKIAIFSVAEIPEILCIGPVEEKNDFDPNLSEIIVDGNCASALLRGAHVYGPGVLAMPSGTKLDQTVNVFADLDNKCKMGTNIQYESENKLYIGTGLVKMQRYKLYGENIDTRGIAIEMISTVSSVPSIGDLSSTTILLQNFPSIVCSRVLNPQQNEILLDMCSAPGNKTTHLAELIKDNGIIIALDTQSRIELVKRKIGIYGFKSIYPFAFDSTKAVDMNLKEKNILNGPPFAPASFDKILLDAPCSALGNRPLLSIGNLKPKMLKSFPNVQKKLFENGVKLLKPGGTMVYSTCTITEAENEAIVDWAKKKFPNLKLVKAEPIFGGVGLDCCGLNFEERRLVQRFGIDNLSKAIDSVGFFIAKFIKD